MKRETCPGCGGRGFTVSLGSMLPCGRCHGMGSIDPVREAIEAKRRDDQLAERIQRHIAENEDILRRLADG